MVLHDMTLTMTYTAAAEDFTSSHVTSNADVTTYAYDTTTNVTSSSFKSYVEYEISHWLLLLYRPLCCIVGVAGNALCVIVLTSSSLRHSPTALYMVTLSCLDLVISVFAGLDVLQKDFVLGEMTFFTYSWHCKLYFFTVLFSAHMDTLTLVSMTSQRYVAVRFPLHAKRWVTKRAAVINIVVAAVIAFIANVVHLVTLEVQPPDGTYRARCEASSHLGQTFLTRVYPWVDFTLYFFFPSVVIIVLNVLILKALRTARKFRRNGVRSGLPTKTHLNENGNQNNDDNRGSFRQGGCETESASVPRRVEKNSKEVKNDEDQNSVRQGGCETERSSVPRRVEKNSKEVKNDEDPDSSRQGGCETGLRSSVAPGVHGHRNKEKANLSSSENISFQRIANTNGLFKDGRQRNTNGTNIKIKNHETQNIVEANNAGMRRSSTGSVGVQRDVSQKTKHSNGVDPTQCRRGEGTTTGLELRHTRSTDSHASDELANLHKHVERMPSASHSTAVCLDPSHHDSNHSSLSLCNNTECHGQKFRKESSTDLGTGFDTLNSSECSDAKFQKEITEFGGDFTTSNKNFNFKLPGKLRRSRSLRQSAATSPGIKSLQRFPTCFSISFSGASSSSHWNSVSTCPSSPLDDGCLSRERNSISVSAISSEGNDVCLSNERNSISCSAISTEATTSLSTASESSMTSFSTTTVTSSLHERERQLKSSFESKTPHEHSTTTVTSNAPAAMTQSSRQLTRMLMTVSVAFLLLTLPLGVFVVVFRLIWNPSSGHEKASFVLFRDVAESLMFTNHAVNIVLYWLSGEKFRTELKAVLARWPCCRGRHSRGRGRTFRKDLKMESSTWQ